MVVRAISGSEIVTDPKEIHNYDTIVINEGVNYKAGKWNFMGGVSDYTKLMVEELSGYKGQLVSYNEKIDLEQLVEKRKELHYLANRKFPRVNLRYTMNGVAETVDDVAIYGDSHSVSIYQPGAEIMRLDGKTLNGFLNKFDDRVLEHQMNYVFYFGNIDLRFHMHRFGGEKAAFDLAKRYIEFAREVNKYGPYSITLQGLLPVDDESRKLPGTGLYKGEKFYGTKEQREKYREVFMDTLLNEFHNNEIIKVREWDLPEDGFSEDTKFKCMESKQSVHLRPEYYLFKDQLC